MEPRFFQGEQVLESSLVGEPDQSSRLGSVGIVVESREYLRALETMLSYRLAQPTAEETWAQLPSVDASSLQD